MLVDGSENRHQRTDNSPSEGRGSKEAHDGVNQDSNGEEHYAEDPLS